MMTVHSPLDLDKIHLMNEKQYYVYFMASRNNNALYVGFTSDLIRRVYEHKSHFVEGFSKQYNTVKLVYYEVCGEALSAIEREKQIKNFRREKKNKLVNAFNPEWNDLYEQIC